MNLLKCLWFGPGQRKGKKGKSSSKLFVQLSSFLYTISRLSSFIATSKIMLQHTVLPTVFPGKEEDGPNQLGFDPGVGEILDIPTGFPNC